jgi:DNA-binding MarR family transcriptional regulator
MVPGGDFDIARIDEIIHGRVRLGVMAYLCAEPAAEFTALKTKLKVTEGTLSVHLRKLEQAGYVAIEKTYKGRRPLTRIHLTAEGKAAFHAYLDAIGRLAGLRD